VVINIVPLAIRGGRGGVDGGDREFRGARA